MPDTRPWRGTDIVLRPQLERRGHVPHALDRLLNGATSVVLARVGRGRRHYAAGARAVLAEANNVAGLTNGALRAAAEELGPLLRLQGLTPTLVERGFALAYVAIDRHLGISLHPAQVAGGLALLDGRLIEMATGEGKTVTAVPAAATMALARMPAHVITVNDYLAERDGAEMKSVYQALGLSVGVVLHEHGAPARRAAYGASVTYVANKELGFDYLRDRLIRSRAARQLRRRGSSQASDVQPVLNGLGYAIVDEADSALIDEARTPLIIAEASGEASLDYSAALEIANELAPGVHFRIDPSRRAAELAEAGRTVLAERASAIPGLWRHRRAREEIVEQALAAQHLYERDRHYILRDGKVEIVDEYTGRVAAGRRWERGLHQLIEAKEAAEPSAQDRTAARITYQSLFRRYVRLAGMSGTVAEHRAEFLTVYGLKVVRLPTHRPLRRTCLSESLRCSATARWNAVADAAARQAGLGRPVLIGTRSIAASEAVAQALRDRGLAHVVLNARQDQDEAAIVAQAGQLGRITVATNIAGRGTDIRLGPGIADRGGLHVILTEFHESTRIDRQLIGRSGRQGDPGSWEAIVSLEDELFRVHAPHLLRVARRLPSALALLVLRRPAQAAAETRHRRERRALLATERMARRMLALAGEGVWL
jgi:preprotein translocase subunit SecA